MRNQLLNSFKAVGLQFPHFLNKKLTLKNVEHALCEYDKYYRAATSQPTRDSHGRSLDLAYYLQRSWLQLAHVFGKGTQGELVGDEAPLIAASLGSFESNLYISKVEPYNKKENGIKDITS